MLPAELILKRLSIIKILFKQGQQQSYQAETVSFFSILSFHDSIEMFLKLAAEHRDVKSDNFNFMDYWEKIPDLTLKEPMRSLNARRVNLKHKGLIPGRIEIESSRIAASDFLLQNFKQQFDVDFSTLSLTELISDEHIRTLLSDAEKELELDDHKKCINHLALAFYHLINRYKDQRTYSRYKSPFSFIEKTEYRVGSGDKPATNDRRLERLFKIVKNNFQNLESAVLINALGLDYRKYLKFRLLTPFVYETSEGPHIYHAVDETKREWEKSDCKFCLDFVFESAWRLQDFDFNYHDLMQIRLK